MGNFGFLVSRTFELSDGLHHELENSLGSLFCCELLGVRVASGSPTPALPGGCLVAKFLVVRLEGEEMVDVCFLFCGFTPLLFALGRLGRFHPRENAERGGTR